MTPDDKIKLIVEAAGEKWHEKVSDGVDVYGPGYVPPKCSCGHNFWDCNKNACSANNPPPHSLDDLVALTEKIFGGLPSIRFLNYGKYVECTLNSAIDGEGSTPAEALLNALVKAVEGRV